LENEMTDEELFRIGSEVYPEGVWLKCRAMMRSAIAAHTTTLLAGVEMPEPATVERADDGSERDLFTTDQLQSYAAAAAAAINALVDALEETQSLLATILHEPRPTDEIEDQIRDNRAALLAARGETK
jgi:hypothetical protein